MAALNHPQVVGLLLGFPHYSYCPFFIYCCQVIHPLLYNHYQPLSTIIYRELYTYPLNVIYSPECSHQRFLLDYTKDPCLDVGFTTSSFFTKSWATPDTFVISIIATIDWKILEASNYHNLSQLTTSWISWIIITQEGHLYWIYIYWIYSFRCIIFRGLASMHQTYLAQHWGSCTVPFGRFHGVPQVLRQSCCGEHKIRGWDAKSGSIRCISSINKLQHVITFTTIQYLDGLVYTPTYHSWGGHIVGLRKSC